LYQKAFPDKVNQFVKDEISKQGADNPSDKMRIRREVVSKIWEEVKDEPEVREVIDAEKSRQAEGKRVKEGNERTPKEYEK
jgi:hypothetical protein